MTIKVLRDKKAALLKEANELQAKDAAGTITEAELTRLNAITDDELPKVNASIARTEKLMDEQRTMAPAAGLDPVPAGTAARSGDNRDPTCGFANVADFAIAVRGACTPATASFADPRLAAVPRAAPTNFHEGGGSSGEGFELPTQMRDQMWELVTDQDDILMLTDLETTSARQVEGTADESTPWGATGVQAYWRSEGGQMTASKMATKGRVTNLHELYAFVLASEELLEDAPRLNTRLTTKSAQAISWKASDAVIYGKGEGSPLGWMNAACKVEVAKESGQAAKTVVAANVLNMYSRLLVAQGDQPFWLANRDTVPQLATMKISEVPVWMPPNGLISAPGGILLGYPVRFSEHAQTLGTAGDLQLVSPKGYYAARRTAGVNFASSMHLYFDYAIQAFRWTFRIGGQPHLSAAVAAAHGNATKSHFVTLAAR
jgi:HK97 family phage major capsid protein